MAKARGWFAPRKQTTLGVTLDIAIEAQARDRLVLVGFAGRE